MPDSIQLGDISSPSYAREFFLEHLPNHGAEWHYDAGTVINDLGSAKQITLSPTAGLGVTLGWNYLDGIYAIMLGIQQLLDEKNYRQTQNKAKGILNIISGVQLFALSYNPILTGALCLSGATALAAPSFALSMLCDLVTASIDFYNANKEVEFEGWLDERVKEANYLQKRIDKIDQQIKTISQQDEVKANSKKLDALQSKKEKLEKDKNELKTTINNRCNVFYDKNHNVENVEKSINEKLPENMVINITAPTDKDRLTDNKIQTQLNEAYKESRTNLAMKTLSFVGMTLLAITPFVAAAVCPPLLITGLAITSLVAAYYLIKNGERIADKVSEVKKSLQHRFFNSAPAKNLVIEEPIAQLAPGI